MRKGYVAAQLRQIISEFILLLKARGHIDKATALELSLSSIPTGPKEGEPYYIEIIRLLRLRRQCYDVAEGSVELIGFLEQQSHLNSKTTGN